ncbi:hypothetical protein CFP56_028536 [Quercus suber]|uniref:Disease resistance protein At4g27190-like leucine-rich repeats domain-containing protein n=1 Tax=Quercus suber TaxID=58331 RepID=A0AAW0JTB3_QUESU
MGGDIYVEYLFKNSLEIAICDDSDIVESRTLLQLLKKSEILKLEEIKDIKNIAYELDNEGFQRLKVLEVRWSDDVEHVMDATSDQNPCAAFLTLESLELRDLYNLKEIYHSQFPERSFSSIHSQLACFGKVRSIMLFSCKCLKNVFSLSIARGLVQLRKLDIEWCDDMEEIFPKEGEDEKELNDKKIMFPQLTHIELQGLPRLIGFCAGVGPVELVQPSLNQEIKECDAIENIVQRDGEEEATDIILFPRVSSLKLKELPNMMSFCIKAYSFGWSSIRKIYLYRCPKLKIIGSEIQSPRKSKKISTELDSIPNEHDFRSPGFLWRCLECVPRCKNYGPMAMSDQGTTNKSQRSYSVKKEGTFSKLKDPKVGDNNNPSEIWSLFPSYMIERLKNLEYIELSGLHSEVLFQLEELNVEESHVTSLITMHSINTSIESCRNKDIILLYTKVGTPSRQFVGGGDLNFNFRGRN